MKAGETMDCRAVVVYQDDDNDLQIREFADSEQADAFVADSVGRRKYVLVRMICTEMGCLETTINT